MRFFNLQQVGHLLIFEYVFLFVNLFIIIDTELAATVRQKLTAAALDLGGGSTQVTFRPLYNRTIDEAPPNFIHSVKVFTVDVKIYTYRYILTELRLFD